MLKTAAIAKAAIGESKAQIARDLDISRNTVARILDEAELSRLVNQGKSSLYERIPEAAMLYGRKVTSDAAEAKEFLERVTVLPAKPQPLQNVNNGVILQFKRDPETPPIQVATKPTI